MTQVAQQHRFDAPLLAPRHEIKPSEGVGTRIFAERGDTLAALAQAQGVPLDALRALNPDMPPFDAIAPGRSLEMPPADLPTPDDGDIDIGHDITRLDTNTPSPAAATPREARERIESLPPANVSDLPPQLPPQERQQVLEQRQAAQDRQIIEIAESALADPQPPEWADYADYPPGIARAEYTSARAQYHEDVAALRNEALDARERLLMRDPVFASLPRETQQAVFDGMRAGTYDPAAQDLLESLVTRSEFTGLDAGQQQQLVALISGDSAAASAARGEIGALLERHANQCFPSELLVDLLQGSRPLEDLTAGLPDNHLDSRRADYTVTGPTTVENHAFQSGNADALRYEVTVNGETVEVFVPAHQDPALGYHTIEEVAAGLASLPKESLTLIERVDVNPERNPDDAHWEQEYNSPGFRSYMTAGAEGVVSIYPSDGNTPGQISLDTALIHETGHILSGQEFGDAEWAEWEAAMDADGVEPSGYATNSRGEDFSETLKLYMLVRGTPAEAQMRDVMPERFAILDRLLA